MTTTREWLSTVTDNASLRSVADRIGEYNVTFTRRLDAGDAHTITAVAREYGVSPIPGLIAAEILNDADLDHYRHEIGLSAYDDLELAEEMLRRIQERQDSPLATVTEFPFPKESNVRGGNDTPDEHNGGYDPLQSVAYDGPDEDALRKQMEGDWTDPDQIP